MQAVHLYYHGLKVTVEAEHGKFLDLLVSYHDFLKSDENVEYREEIHIHVNSGKRLENEFFGSVYVDENSIMKRCSSRKMAEVSINPYTNDVTASLPSPDDFIIEALFEAVFMQPLKYLAKKHGIFFMHASSVALNRDTGILFIGDQGAGKSTMALNLLMHGYYYVAEESPAVVVRDNEPVLYGFPEPLGISRKSLVNFPMLKKYCSETTFPYLKHRIRFDTIKPGMTLKECRPAAIFFPEYRDHKSHEFEELTTEDAMKTILGLELELYQDKFNLELAQQHMAALGTLVEGTRIFRMFYNDSCLSDIPASIANLLTDVT